MGLVYQAFSPVIIPDPTVSGQPSFVLVRTTGWSDVRPLSGNLKTVLFLNRHTDFASAIV